ncbi:uncharacterized protein LOC127844162 isoform X2 [Dreissena polymorpha]|uniref:uncharacterized protein LOC127844162 isoform X2 n=1 Tax=Dreissena polymorpha TaxID=45954 RepID=UPI00226423E0|nr:uncharacterized protein LOC127844162 isoform X2 [Dreissena polymorpha]
MSGTDPRQRMEPRLIKEISKEISTEFTMLRIYLGFTEPQFARLKHAYPNMDDQIFALLNAWHDVVVGCGENPRHLLAAALHACENRYLAVSKLVTPKELDGLTCREREPQAETKKRIQQINFSVPGDSVGAGSVNNYGAHNAVNVFSGGTFINHGDLSLASDYSGVSRSSSADSFPLIQKYCQFKDPNVEMSDHEVSSKPNIRRLLEQHVSRSSSADSFLQNQKYGQLKKPFDDTMTQRMMGIYIRCMESVGPIMTHSRTCGTGFRVGSNYIMTAWHVITSILDPTQTGQLNGQNLQEAYISFSDPPTAPNVIIFTFKCIAYFHKDLDIAILEISDANQRLPVKLSLRKEDIPHLKHLSLIGFGHPKNPGKHFEYRCPIVYQQNQASLTAFVQKHRQDIINHLDVTFVGHWQSKGIDPGAVVDRGYQDADNKLLIHCFMEQGASGSPILACVDAAAGIVEVVGVLTHCIPDYFFCLNNEGKKWILEKEFRFEAGSRMKFIFQFLCSENPDLAQAIFS